MFPPSYRALTWVVHFFFWYRSVISLLTHFLFFSVLLFYSSIRELLTLLVIFGARWSIAMWKRILMWDKKIWVQHFYRNILWPWKIIHWFLILGGKNSSKFVRHVGKHFKVLSFKSMQPNLMILPQEHFSLPEWLLTLL